MNIQNSKPGRRETFGGFTLLELLVVVVILVATAIIVLPIFTANIEVREGVVQTPRQISTQATLNVIQEAMVGDEGVYENLGHRPEALPRNVKELVDKQAPVHLKETAPELDRYDPICRVGWHGPYLFPTGTNQEGQSTLVDAWGNELKIQVDFDGNGVVDKEESQHMRIVSAGPNGQIETPLNVSNMKPGDDQHSELTRSECGDDLVVFVRIPDSRE